ncbi:MAG: hypothetical protein FJ385_07270 [Verrucomicrobia bacterium]|nr:hypothetical protein [Verrucomicrobiota bacterium]
MKPSPVRTTLASLLLAVASAHAFVSVPIWSENFESYTAGNPPTSLEVQTGGDWLTGPENTESFVIESASVYSLPSGTFGSSVLVAGGYDPVDPEVAGVSYLTGPEEAYYTPEDGDLPGFRFRMDFILSPGPTGTDLVDSFRLGFYDQSAAPNAYSFYSFIPGDQEGEVKVLKDDTNSQIMSGITIQVNSAYTLDIRADMELNFAFAYIYLVGGTPGSGFTLFSPSLFNHGDDDDNNLGDFTIDWLSADGENNWDDNYMIIDNIRIEQIPEPSAALFGLLSAAALLRRRRN